MRTARSVLRRITLAIPSKLVAPLLGKGELGTSISVEHEASLRGALGERLHRARDGVQRVVDLVGHAGHELSEAFHFLAVEQSGLRFLQVE